MGINKKRGIGVSDYANDEWWFIDMDRTIVKYLQDIKKKDDDDP